MIFDAALAMSLRGAAGLAPHGLRLRGPPLDRHEHRGVPRPTGNREQAEEHLTTATTMNREMDMRFWLEKAEAEMAAAA
jgi:hypothetical protein